MQGRVPRSSFGLVQDLPVRTRPKLFVSTNPVGRLEIQESYTCAAVGNCQHLAVCATKILVSAKQFPDAIYIPEIG